MRMFAQRRRGAEVRKMRTGGGIALAGILALGILGPGAGAWTAEPAQAAPQAAAPAGAAEVLAFGDIHGDFATFQALLRSVGLIDGQDRWAGGRRHLVQTGDLLHRGTRSREVMDLLMRLEGEAARAGGAVTVLLGNHEIMDLTGDLRYNTPEEFAAFQEEEIAEERSRRKERILGLVRQGSPRLRSGFYALLGRSLDERTFDRVFPPGFFAQREAMSPRGPYGKWLLGHRTVHLEAGTFFVHGGLGPAYARQALEDLNAEVRSELGAYFDSVGELERLGAFDAALGVDALQDLLLSERRARGPGPELAPAFRRLDRILKGILFDEASPFWYRGLAEEGERGLRKPVEALLAFHGAERIVMGHTYTDSLGIESRLGGRIWLIDTGMNKAVYGGRPQALVIPPEGEPRVLR
jgi:hypothetical protein